MVTTVRTAYAVAPDTIGALAVAVAVLLEVAAEFVGFKRGGRSAAG